ncbi:hypothetical protein V1511DRAFT_502938 [Dipodascopsis uninucleata]
MARLDSLPDEILEKIVAFLAPCTEIIPDIPHRNSEKDTEREVEDDFDAVVRPTHRHRNRRGTSFYGTICKVALVCKRLNYICTPILYRMVMLRVSELSDVHEKLLRVVRGPTGAFVKIVSIRDPDPVSYPRIITPNYRNKLIFAFSNFLVQFFEALSEYSNVSCFHWNVFDTLVMPPMFMDFLPQGIKEFYLDQGRVIPVGVYNNLQKFVYRAHLLSCTSNCIYEKRVSRLLHYNFDKIRYLQLQNVNLAACFEFRTLGSNAYPPSIGLDHLGYYTIPPELATVANLDGPVSGSWSSIHSTIGYHGANSLHSSSPVLLFRPTSNASPEDSASSSTASYISHASPPLSSTTTSISPISSDQVVHFSNLSRNNLVFLPIAPANSRFLGNNNGIILPNLRTAIFTDLFTPSSVTSYNCHWLIHLLTDHISNKDLTITYATRCVGKDAVFAKEWGLLHYDRFGSNSDIGYERSSASMIGSGNFGYTENSWSNSVSLDEELAFRNTWADGKKGGVWKGWSWEYSTVTGWKFSTVSSASSRMTESSNIRSQTEYTATFSAV